jgi:zinc protease
VALAHHRPARRALTRRLGLGYDALVRATANGIRTSWRGALAASLVVFATAGSVACSDLPLKGDSGIKPFNFDLWDLHCPSGLRVLFERAPGTTTAAVTVVVGAGATADPAGREGLAHLVEHLTFRAHGPNEGALQMRLWALGAGHNAETGFEETTYHELAPAVRLPAVLAAEGRRLLDPLEGLDEATFNVEREVVRNELRERNETHAFGAAYASAFRAAFAADHPFHRNVGGTHESLSALTLDDARRFVAAHYRPDDMTMVIVGDMDLSAVDGFVRATLPPALYGDPAHPHPIGQPPVPPADAPAPPPDRTLHRERAPVTTPELWIAWSIPGGVGRGEEIAEMWSTLTAQNFNRGRFDDDDIGGVNFVTFRGVASSMLICRVVLTTGAHPDRSMREVVSALPWIGGDEVYLDDRFRHLKLARLRELVSDAEDVVDRARERAEYARRTGSPSAYGPLIAQIKGISSEKARAFAERYLTADRARGVFLEPLADDARPPTPIAAAQDLASLPPLPPETLQDLAQVRFLEGLQRLTLDNGLEVVVVPRRGASVITAKLAFHVDRGTTLTGLPRAAQEAHEITLEESPGDFGIAYRFDVGEDLLSFTVRSGVANLPRALDMLSYGARSLNVDWPSDKFRDVEAPLLRRYEASPEGRGARALWKAMFGAHPFGARPTVDQIAGHKAGEIEDWLERVVRPANGVLVIVGDVSAAEAQTAARDALKRLGGKPGAIAAPAAATPAAGGPGARVLDDGTGAIVTHRPGASQAEVELRCLLPPADARRDAANDVVAGLVGARIQDDLRHRWGSTYGVLAWASTLRGGSAYLVIRSNVDNGHLPRALHELREVWASFVTKGVADEDVRRARDTLAVDRLLRYDTSPALVNGLVDRWNQGWDLGTIDEAPAQLASVAPAEVDATLRACAANMVVGVTGDEGVIRAAFAARDADARDDAGRDTDAPLPPSP